VRNALLGVNAGVMVSEIDGIRSDCTAMKKQHEKTARTKSTSCAPVAKSSDNHDQLIAVSDVANRHPSTGAQPVGAVGRRDQQVGLVADAVIVRRSFCFACLASPSWARRAHAERRKCRLG